MAGRKAIVESPTWMPRSKPTIEVHLHLCGSHFTLDKDLLASKSAKIANLLDKNPYEDLSLALRDIPADQDSMELVGRFCHGFEIHLSTENIVRVACVAHYLGMTDSHCPNNLLSMAFLFFEHYVLPSWNNSIRALKSAETVLQHAVKLGLIDYCLESIISKVLDDPHLLGEPLKNLSSDDDDDSNIEIENGDRPNARRKLFDVDWKFEDLTTLSLRLYVPTIRAMAQRGIPQEYVAANLCQYGQKWVNCNDKFGDEVPSYKRNSQREIVEALVKLLPHHKGIVPCSFLLEMLRSAIALDANADCRNELEIRIGKQLDQASVKDLLIPLRGYTRDEQYDTELVRRILKRYYCNYVGPDLCGLHAVADLMDDFLAEIAADIDLKMSTFLEFADMLATVSKGTPRTWDGIYKAIDAYLEKHRHLTESEREELCRVLDYNKLSVEACEHAAQNARLPVRVIIQVLFVSQLKLREVIPKEVQCPDKRMEEGGSQLEEEEEEERAEISQMGSKVMELERECHAMRREIQRERGVRRQKKVSVWKKMKRKMGCVNTMHDANCHVKKKKVHSTTERQKRHSQQNQPQEN